MEQRWGGKTTNVNNTLLSIENLLGAGHLNHLKDAIVIALFL